MLENEVDVSVAAGGDDSLQLDDVGVAQLPQEHDLAVCALRVGGVAKRVEVFLEGLHCPCAAIVHLPHVPVCATAYFLDDLVLFDHMRVDFLSHLIITDTTHQTNTPAPFEKSHFKFKIKT